MFPQSFIDKIKNTIDMKLLAEEYTELKKVGKGVYRGRCPHPNHIDKNPSFCVWTKFNSWCCQTCHQGKKSEKFENYGTDCIAFIMWIEKKSWVEAVKYLAKKYNIPLPSRKNEKLFKQKKELAYSYMENLKGKPFKYLCDRGLNSKDCYEWGIGFDSERIIFPLLDRYKNVLGFTKRWLNMPKDADDKYRNSSNNAIFNKSMYLYGIHKLDTSFNEIRITEGTMDVILATKYGGKNIVATLGTAFTESHIEIIKHYNLLPVFCMDGDSAGLKSMQRSAELLAEHNIYCKILILPSNKDMADLALIYKDKLEDYITENSITYGNYLIEKELSLYIAKSNELKLKYYPKLLKILKQVPCESEKQVLDNYIKNIMEIKIL